MFHLSILAKARNEKSILSKYALWISSSIEVSRYLHLNQLLHYFLACQILHLLTNLFRHKPWTWAWHFLFHVCDFIHVWKVLSNICMVFPFACDILSQPTLHRRVVCGHWPARALRLVMSVFLCFRSLSKWQMLVSSNDWSRDACHLLLYCLHLIQKWYWQAQGQVPVQSRGPKKGKRNLATKFKGNII